MAADVPKKRRKKLSPHELTPQGKFLVGGVVGACVVLFLGMPVAVWLGWNANDARQSCVAQVNALTIDMTKASPSRTDTIATAENARNKAADTPACRHAVAASATLNAAIKWLYRSVIILLILSPGPWLVHLMRKTRGFD